MFMMLAIIPEYSWGNNGDDDDGPDGPVGWMALFEHAPLDSREKQLV